MKAALFLCAVLLIRTVNAANIILYPIEDSYLNSGSPNTNYGTLDSCYCGQDYQYPYPHYDPIIKFNISGLPSPVLSAYLYYNQEFVSVQETIGVAITADCYSVYTNWTETGVTFNNQPPIIKQVSSEYQDNDVFILSCPVTIAIADGLNGGNQVIGILTRSNYVVSLFERESNIDNRPYLIVTVPSP